jgi:RHS repeat-associated protein
VVISLRPATGQYRIQADLNGTQFWSSGANHCAVPGWAAVTVVVTLPVTVTVQATDGTPKAGLPVYASSGGTYTGFNQTTDADGQVSITLPEGNYRFRADVDGVQFWSGDENHCEIAGCTSVLMTIPDPVLVVVQDTGGTPKQGLPVYVFDGSTYTGRSGTTNANGEVTLRLPEGEYDFRVDFNGTQFWNDAFNHCSVPGCTLAGVIVTIPAVVTVEDSLGMPQAGLPVYAFSGGIYTGYNGTSDASGQAVFTLPMGDYRFRADSGGTQFWSGATDHCTIPGCLDATVVVTVPVTVTVQDTDGVPKAGLPVYVFDGATYTGFNGTTDASGQVSFTLPEGTYRFRADLNGTQFWSGGSNHCAVPGCSAATVVVTLPVTVTVEDTDGAPKAGLPVYAFSGGIYTGYNRTTNASGQAVFTLPQGDYRFRADLNGTQFWSGTTDHCAIPDCTEGSVAVTIPVTVTVQDWAGAPLQALPVYAFSGGSYTGYNKITNASGQAVFTLPQGSYRFRADYQGVQYWSGAGDHCTIAGCLEVTMVAGVAPTATSTPTPTPTETPTDTPAPTQTPSSTPTPTETPTPTPTPTDTPAPSPTDTPTPEPPTPEPTATEVGFLGSSARMAKIRPAPAYAPLSDPAAVVVTVLDTDGLPQQGLPVYVFDGISYTGFNATTDEYGQASITLPDGSYRFRADLNGTQFWSGESNHCTIPGCAEAGITVTIPVTITVQDTDGLPKEGLPVYAFSGGSYTGYNAGTNAAGQVQLTLPQGDYRFRADLNGTQFWSGETDHCALPGCETATLVVTLPVTVTVSDTDAVPQEGLPVYVFDEAAYTGYNGVTDADGEVVFTLPQGDYRFRSDLYGTQFWSGTTDHCALPGCTEASITVTIPVTVTVQSETGSPYPDLPVYAFDGESYTGYHGTSDASGQVVFTLPVGDYRFRADYDGVQFWSGTADHCTIPGCLEALVEIPGGVGGPVSVTIDYSYDPLQRLVAADYSTGEFFHYSYDAVGNRLMQDTLAGANTYAYDIANRLIEVDGVSYAWDDNGNLLDDGLREYAYDHANRLISVEMGADSHEFGYNGLGDRLRQTANGAPTDYTLDLATGLTQVLSDGDNAYLYGLTRIGEQQPDGWQYHLGDALGSVRQLANYQGVIGLAQAHQPFGFVLTTSGDIDSTYGFTGEQTDPTGMVFLRARYYMPEQGRFMTKDVWVIDPHRPMSHNAWMYTRQNPVNYTDPTGQDPIQCQKMPSASDFERCVLDYYHVSPIDEQMLGAGIVGARGCYRGKVHYRAPGYIEGVGGFVGTTWGGIERVYSFARMERVEFVFLGLGLSDSTVGAGLADYSGAALGLPSNKTLSESYRGLSLTGQAGISIPLGLFFKGAPGSVGSGISVFKSLDDPQIWGATLYVGGTLSQELLKGPFSVLDVGGAVVQYYSLTGSERYYADGKKVNRLALLADLITSSSIWVEPVYPLALVGRGSAAAAGLYYAWVYEELAALAE